MQFSTLKKYVEYIFVAALLSVFSFQLSFFWKHEQINLVYGSVIAVAIFLIAFFGRVTLRRAWLPLVIVIAILCSQRIAHQFPDAPEWRGITAFLWHGSQEPRLRVLWGAAFSLSLAWVLAPSCAAIGGWCKKKIQMSEPQKWRLAIAFTLVLSAYSSALAFLRHRAFLSTAFDFGIFDQALFQFSRFTAPVSTVRQFTSLFLDHQHFAIALLSPLYWLLRGMHGFFLATLSPFLLIAIPSVMLALAVREITGKKSPWVAVFSAAFIFIHPFTQASVGFYFHEKFLVPALLSVVLYALARYVRRRDRLSLIIATISTLLWMLSKEDQWLFIVAASVQLVVHVFLWSKDRVLRKKFSIWAASMTGISVIYALILHHFSSRFNPMYTGMYTQLKNSSVDVLHTGNVYEFFSSLNLFTDAHLYLYQHFFGIDVIGFFALPLNIIGEYAERILNSSPSIQSPFYHYGAAVPFYVVVGIVALVLILRYRAHSLTQRVLPLALVVVVFGLLMVSGWNKLYYLHTIPQAVVRDFANTHHRRVVFWDAVKIIPADASVVAAEGYAPQLSARQQIFRWPDEVKLPAGSPGKVDMLSYEYWVLPPTPFLKNDTTDYAAQIQFLQTQGYVIISQNEFVVILKKNTEI